MSASFQIDEVFNVDVTHLFNHFKDPDKMRKWIYLDDFETSKIENNFSLDGSYSVTAPLPDGTPISWEGIYKSIRVDSYIEFTWTDSDIKDSIVKLKFVPQGEHRTLLHLSHENFPDSKSMLEHKAIWLENIQHLKEYVENPLPVPKISEKSFDAGGAYY